MLQLHLLLTYVLLLTSGYDRADIHVAYVAVNPQASLRTSLNAMLVNHNYRRKLHVWMILAYTEVITDTQLIDLTTWYNHKSSCILFYGLNANLLDQNVITFKRNTGFSTTHYGVNAQ